MLTPYQIGGFHRIALDDGNNNNNSILLLQVGLFVALTSKQTEEQSPPPAYPPHCLYYVRPVSPDLFLVAAKEKVGPRSEEEELIYL